MTTLAAGAVEVTPEVVRSGTMTGGGVRAAARDPRPRSELDRARHHLGPVVRALLLQVLQGLSAGVSDRGAARGPGAGRERRHRGHRPRLGGGLQDGVAQPSELHRALPGIDDRRRRHPARHLHHGRAADRLHGLAALRRDRRAAHALPDRRRGARHRRLRQLRGHPHGRRRDRVPPLLQREHPGQRLRPGGRPARRDLPRPGERRRATRSSTSGSRTGRDGIHGATMASESFDAESEQKRPTVQVGDPFTEKVLLEACLEAMRTGAIVAIQDMGAAGLTSSTLRDGRPRRHGPAARSSTGCRCASRAHPLRDDALRVAGAHGPGGEEGARGGARQGLPPLGAGGGATIGEVTDTGRAVLEWQGRRGGRHPDPAAHRGGAGLPPARGRAGRSRRALARRPRCPSRRTSRQTWSGCSPRRSSPARRGSGASTTTRCAPTPCRGRAATPRCCCSRGRRRGSP